MRILWLAALPLIVAGCGQTVPTFTKLDGRALNPEQLATDKVICQGELSKAWMSSTVEGLGRHYAALDVYDACMAQRGYRVTRT